VREEGQATQDDPGPEQACRDRKDQDLDKAALDERELKRVEDSKSLMRMNPVCACPCFRRGCHRNQTEIGLSTLRYLNFITQNGLEYAVDPKRPPGLTLKEPP
jgi:hypothetical protein